MVFYRLFCNVIQCAKFIFHFLSLFFFFIYFSILAFLLLAIFADPQLESMEGRGSHGQTQFVNRYFETSSCFGMKFNLVNCHWEIQPFWNLLVLKPGKGKKKNPFRTLVSAIKGQLKWCKWLICNVEIRLFYKRENI